ncbi:hypothetical protein JCM5350_005461 [Sporobolomyces pararoseus]
MSAPSTRQSSLHGNTSTSKTSPQIGLHYGSDHWPEAERKVVPAGWRPPDLVFNADKLPPLLEISDSDLAQRAVLHKTALPGLTQEQARNLRYFRESQSYEMLETRGDALIYEVVTDSLFAKVGTMTPGPFSDVRKMLLNNVTLAHLSVAYELPSRLLYFGPSPLAREQSVAADLFEAHIGALVTDPGVGRERTMTWLASVFDPDVFYTVVDVAAEMETRKVARERDRVERKMGLPSTHPPPWECRDCDSGSSNKSKLVKVIYSNFHQIQGWHAQLYVNGIFKSCGRGDKKPEAACNAAFNHVCRTS